MVANELLPDLLELVSDVAEVIVDLVQVYDASAPTVANLVHFTDVFDLERVRPVDREVQFVQLDRFCGRLVALIASGILICSSLALFGLHIGTLSSHRILLQCFGELTRIILGGLDILHINYIFQIVNFVNF